MIDAAAISFTDSGLSRRAAISGYSAIATAIKKIDLIESARSLYETKSANGSGIGIG
jgi:hypothetical protein